MTDDSLDASSAQDQTTQPKSDPAAIRSAETSLTQSSGMGAGFWKWLTVWWICWLGGFAGYTFAFVPFGFGHYGTPTVAGIYWCCLSVFVIVRFRETLQFQSLNKVNVVVIGLMAVAVSSVAYYGNTYLHVDPKMWDFYKTRNIGIVIQNIPYYSGKLPELLFQQVMILLLVRKLQGLTVSTSKLLMLFAIGFGGVHLPIIVVQGWTGIAFIVAATSATLVFVPPILLCHNGIIYSFSIHLGAYTVCGFCMRYFAQA